MPSSDTVDNGGALEKPKRQTTPRRSPAVRRGPNATPTRKSPAVKAGAPNSAPAGAKPLGKKPEPTLLGDFLLGRPSVSRPRRKSLDVVKAEMKKGAVSKVQPPGGVKDRVRQWQKASAVAATEDVDDPVVEPDGAFEKIDEESVTEEDRRRIKFRKQHTSRPDRRKSSGREDAVVPLKGSSSPKKRVVSDDHWMIKKEKKNPPRTTKISDEIIPQGVALPKNFTKMNSTKPPLEKKIGDWTKRIANDGDTHDQTHSKKVSKSEVVDDGIYILQERNTSRDNGMVVAEQHWKSTDRHEIRPSLHTPRRKEKKARALSSEMEKSWEIGRDESAGGNEGSPSDLNTPSHRPRVKNRQRKSDSPESLADIPVGYSAFSVLDIPTNGSTKVRKSTKPQRQPSLSVVPKVLRKVYEEGIKIVHDTVEPPRTGRNQPPSIESWLKGTSDPFVDEVPVHQGFADTSLSGKKVQNHTSRNSCMEESALKTESGISGEREGSKHRSSSLQRSNRDTPVSTESLRGGSQQRRSIKSTLDVVSTIPSSPTELKGSPAPRDRSTSMSSNTMTHKDAVNGAINANGEHDKGDESLISVVDDLETRKKTKRASSGHGIDRRTSAACSPNLESNSREMHLPRSPGMLNISTFDKPNVPAADPNKLPSREDVKHSRLSTIASVETFKSLSSLPDASSELSQTTVTQTTVTQNTSNTSNTSYTRDAKPSISYPSRKPSRLKRRLTKHSDLLSVLSLPDASLPGRSKSIKSARSIRTARSDLSTATARDLLRELADDEVKYMRELKTMVDGVIPVLLSCIISKSEPAVAAGLFNLPSGDGVEHSMTKPIVDMGIALEQLKSSHKQIPLNDLEMLSRWATRTYKVYEDYLNAWRMGFQDIVINLAPASNSHDAEKEPSLIDMPRNMNGDVLNENGERVDVAFLLKRPLVRVKYLAKVISVRVDFPLFIYMV
jgi:hypothetical protein